MAQPIEAFRNAFKIPELKGRILFTLLILAIYRLGAHVPTPGVDGRALAEMMEGSGGLLGFYDMFSGGAFRNPRARGQAALVRRLLAAGPRRGGDRRAPEKLAAG